MLLISWVVVWLSAHTQPPMWLRGCAILHWPRLDNTFILGVNILSVYFDLLDFKNLVSEGRD